MNKRQAMKRLRGPNKRLRLWFSRDSNAEKALPRREYEEAFALAVKHGVDIHAAFIHCGGDALRDQFAALQDKLKPGRLIVYTLRASNLWWMP